jgi:hypothetical protein
VRREEEQKLKEEEERLKQQEQEAMEEMDEAHDRLGNLLMDLNNQRGLGERPS